MGHRTFQAVRSRAGFAFGQARFALRSVGSTTLRPQRARDEANALDQQLLQALLHDRLAPRFGWMLPRRWCRRSAWRRTSTSARRAWRSRRRSPDLSQAIASTSVGARVPAPGATFSCLPFEALGLRVPVVPDGAFYAHGPTAPAHARRQLGLQLRHDAPRACRADAGRDFGHADTGRFVCLSYRQLAGSAARAVRRLPDAARVGAACRLRQRLLTDEPDATPGPREKPARHGRMRCRRRRRARRRAACGNPRPIRRAVRRPICRASARSAATHSSTASARAASARSMPRTTRRCRAWSRSRPSAWTCRQPNASRSTPFLNEARARPALSPNIVTVFDAGVSDGGAYRDGAVEGCRSAPALRRGLAADTGAGGTARAPGGRGAGVRARARRRAQRHQAGQHLHGRALASAGARLRHRARHAPPGRAAPRPELAGGSPYHYGARADPAAAGRRAQRRLRARRGAVPSCSLATRAFRGQTLAEIQRVRYPSSARRWPATWRRPSPRRWPASPHARWRSIPSGGIRRRPRSPASCGMARVRARASRSAPMPAAPLRAPLHALPVRPARSRWSSRSPQGCCSLPAPRGSASCCSGMRPPCRGTGRAGRRHGARPRRHRRQPCGSGSGRLTRSAPAPPLTQISLPPGRHAITLRRGEAVTADDRCRGRPAGACCTPFRRLTRSPGRGDGTLAHNPS